MLIKQNVSVIQFKLKLKSIDTAKWHRNLIPVFRKPQNNVATIAKRMNASELGFPSYHPPHRAETLLIHKEEEDAAVNGLIEFH